MEKAEVKSQKIEISQEESRQKGLLIFLDDTEKDEIGAISSNLLVALYQEACPIIASSSLLYNILKQRKKDTREINILLYELRGLLLTPMREDIVSQKNDIVISKISFNPERWIIKKISNSLNLLIPVNYLDSLNIDHNTIKKYGTMALSDIELQLGFKVNHMETITSEQIHNPQSVYNADYFIDALDTIFCKKSDYIQRKIDIPEWIIFINGHGLTNETITGLTFSAIKKLLYFLEHTIIMQLLVAKSCYIAGVNTEKIYGKITSGTQQYYSFPIIVQGLNDLATTAMMPDVDWAEWQFNKKIQLNIDIDFVSFLKKAKNLEGDYSEIIKPITLNVVENIPQIKLPGLEWFSVMEVNKKIVSIGSILAETRDPQKPLDVVSFFKKDPEVILLYTDNIPFELKIHSNKVKAMVSMVSSGPWEDKPDLVVHRIKKISSTQSFAEIMRWFTSMAESSGDKLFFINNIGANKDIVKDVVIFCTDDHFVKIYGKDKNNRSSMGIFKEKYPIKSTVIKDGSDEQEDYEDKLYIIHDAYPEASAGKKKEINVEWIQQMENILTKQHKKQKVLSIKGSPAIQ